MNTHEEPETCRGHITEDFAIFSVLGAWWGCTPSEAVERYESIVDSYTEEEAQAQRIMNEVVSLLNRHVEHMKGPCCEHAPDIRAILAERVA